jgi:hypothetical protein
MTTCYAVNFRSIALKASFSVAFTGLERGFFLIIPEEKNAMILFQKTTDGLKEEGYGF